MSAQSRNQTAAATRTPPPRLTAVAGLRDTAADVLVVGVVPGGASEDGRGGTDGPADDPALSAAEASSDALPSDTVAALVAAFGAVGADGSPGSTHRIPAPDGLGVRSVLGVGLGPDAQTAAASAQPGAAADSAPAETAIAAAAARERLRSAAGTAARALKGAEHAVTTLSLHAAGPVAEGFAMGAYRFAEYTTPRPSDPPVLQRVDLVVAESPGSSGSSEPADAPSKRGAQPDPAGEIERAAAVANAVATARDLVNTPPSHLYPAEFADRAGSLGRAAGMEVEVLDEDLLAEGGYGGILGVGKGSSRPPRLVIMRHRGGRNSTARPSVALVGKGVTFDSGGISIKPAAGMENMTSDMGGAAAVVATAALAAQLDLPIDVTAYVPMAENLPSATAQRPGDVLTQYDGTTVEVINTDAEGRLILADAISRACEDSPTHLIDTATLTGAQLVALGTRTPGVMGTDAFRDRVAVLSRGVGENGWAMPLAEELRADLDSKIADIKNVTGKRAGGMLVAGLFLREFVADGVEWAHLDVAGPAYNTGSAHGYTPWGGTGVPVRTMFAVLEDLAAESADNPDD